MENLSEDIQNSKGLFVSSNPTHWYTLECPHCDAITYISYDSYVKVPESPFCPVCGIKEEIPPLDYDDVNFGDDADWDE